MKFLLYNGRHGEQLLTYHTPEAWEFLKYEMVKDNRASFEEIRRDMGEDALSGSLDYHKDAHLSIDDGGDIDTIELTVVGST